MSEALKDTMLEEPREPEVPNFWDKWKLTDGTYKPPDPVRFKEFADNVPRGDMPQMAKVIVRYSLERAGLLLTPEQVSEPLLKLDSADELSKTKILDSFVEYCDMAEEVWGKIEEASELASQYSFDQIRFDLPAKTNDAERLATMKIVRAMNKSDNEAFARVAGMTKSQSSAILRIMYGWEQGVDLPKPGNHLNSVS